jgi:hypothetical protein
MARRQDGRRALSTTGMATRTLRWRALENTADMAGFTAFAPVRACQHESGTGVIEARHV